MDFCFFGDRILVFEIAGVGRFGHQSEVTCVDSLDKEVELSFSAYG